jgi:peptidyl-dipeptidase A
MSRILAVLVIVALAACSPTADAPTPGREGTPDEARKFLQEVNDTMLKLSTSASQAAWTYSTYITPDTEALNARANQEFIEAVAKYAKDATRFDNVQLSADERRQLDLLKLSLVLVTPADPKKAEELTRIAAAMEGAYGKGKWCSPAAGDEDGCLDVEEITEIMASNRDPKRLREVWEGWHTIAPPIKKDFVRYVELANEGARELGFKDTGAMWRS